MDIVLSPKDTEWIATQYPGLEINWKKKIIQGDVYVSRSYAGIALDGIFSIEIELWTRANTMIPKVYETGNKLLDIANQLGLSTPKDIHVNDDRSICMVINIKEKSCFKKDFTIEEFFDNCLEPYFYWVMYYQKYGKKPWDDYAHGELGYLEMFAESDLSYNETVKHIGIFKAKRYSLTDIDGTCLCGSNKSMKTCHLQIYRGLLSLKQVRGYREMQNNQVANIHLAEPLISPELYIKIS